MKKKSLRLPLFTNGIIFLLSILITSTICMDNKTHTPQINQRRAIMRMIGSNPQHRLKPAADRPYPNSVNPAVAAYRPSMPIVTQLPQDASIEEIIQYMEKPDESSYQTSPINNEVRKKITEVEYKEACRSLYDCVKTECKHVASRENPSYTQVRQVYEGQNIEEYEINFTVPPGLKIFVSTWATMNSQGVKRDGFRSIWTINEGFVHEDIHPESRIPESRKEFALIKTIYHYTAKPTTSD